MTAPAAPAEQLLPQALLDLDQRLRHPATPEEISKDGLTNATTVSQVVINAELVVMEQATGLDTGPLRCAIAELPAPNGGCPRSAVKYLVQNFAMDTAVMLRTKRRAEQVVGL